MKKGIILFAVTVILSVLLIAVMHELNVLPFMETSYGGWFYLISILILNMAIPFTAIGKKTRWFSLLGLFFVSASITMQYISWQCITSPRGTWGFECLFHPNAFSPAIYINVLGGSMYEISGLPLILIPIINVVFWYLVGWVVANIPYGLTRLYRQKTRGEIV